jgi:hypothetical protein
MMRIRHVLALAFLTFIFAGPSASNAQTTQDLSSTLIGHAFDEVVADGLVPIQATPAYATLQDLTPAPKEEAHPTPRRRSPCTQSTTM